jgi:hypothetical protein
MTDAARWLAVDVATWIGRLLDIYVNGEVLIDELGPLLGCSIKTCSRLIRLNLRPTQRRA